MAITVTRSGDWSGVAGNLRYAYITVAFDSSYPTGGESFTPSDVGMREFLHVHVHTKSGYAFEYDYTNEKILAYYTRGSISNTLAATVASGAVAVTSTAANGAIVNLSGVAGVAAGTGEQVANATDLSALTGVRVFCWGM